MLRSLIENPMTLWTRCVCSDKRSLVVIDNTYNLFPCQMAYYTIKCIRFGFDIFSGYAWGKIFGTLDEKKWLTRIIFLETVAGVPGMIAAMTRHLRSLRSLQRDHGWIHTLLG